MKIVLAAALSILTLAALHIPKLKNKRGFILGAYATAMILFFAVYNYRTMDHIVRFSHPVNQSMYQPEFFAGGEYVDAFLDSFFDGRTVYTPDDAYDVSDDTDVNDDSANYDEDGNYWLYDYYHAVNMWRYLEFNHVTVIKDSSLNGLILTEEQKSYFEDLGAANDMMRYTFPLTPYNGEWGNGFYYFWFYNYFIEDSRIYMCTSGLDNADELVVIWQHEDRHDTDSYYIASKTFFDTEILK